MSTAPSAHVPGIGQTDTDDVLTWLARLGYAARGVVYLLVGGLALLAAFGAGGELTGSKGALATLADETWGQVLLFIIGVGLLGHALWRFLQAHYDLDRHGKDAKGLAVRGGLLASAVIHLLLATWVYTLLFENAGSGGGDEGSHKWVSWLLDKPGGKVWVTLLGLAVIGAGVAQIIKGWREKFEKYLSVNYERWPWANAVCRFGLVARGVVFLILGWFFIQAAVQSDSGEAKGLGGVLEWLQEQPWGGVLLGVMALGLLAFGVYSLIEAVYRRIQTPNEAKGA